MLAITILVRYIFNQNKDNPKAALQQCLTLKTSPSTCIRGMAAGILRSNLLNPEKIEDYCNSVPDYKTSCLQGAVNYHLLMFGQNNKTKEEMCNRFTESTNISSCLHLIDISPFKS